MKPICYLTENKEKKKREREKGEKETGESCLDVFKVKQIKLFRN